MKTVTVKFPEKEAKELDTFIKEKNYPSKSEFIRNLVKDKLNEFEKEKQGWLVLAEQKMKELWDNEEDEKVWGKYL
ncbi:hypothetical protein COT72_03765 [archaeon CG10_big_fil_rev_8_21_14_0_10_43_11]|nr:MAG: hypothetical protein COT72_03765 [archaeon CG10_big_fil_rev_8_21_14_0_10_43_11]